MRSSVQQNNPVGPNWGGSWPHLAALAGRGGHIVFGYVAPPIEGVAVATEDTRVHATLFRCEGETFNQVLARLDAAIGESRRTGYRCQRAGRRGICHGHAEEMPGRDNLGPIVDVMRAFTARVRT
jgi:hypothetical protein